MYKSIFYDKSRELLHLWDDEAGYLCRKFKNFGFVKSEFGKYRTLHGEKVDKIYDFNYDNPNVYEADLPVETKILMELYRDTDEPAKNIKVLIIDIETDSSGGFPNMKTFDKEITAFSYYDKTADQYKCLILDKESKVNPYIKGNIEVIPYDNEESLLKGILHTFEQIRPDIVTGWNICYNGDGNGFDIPYIYGRICKLLGAEEATRLSEIGKCYTKKHDDSVVIAGVNMIDYMLLYKKFRFEPRQNYRLGYIGSIEVNKDKVKYEGSLNQLYKEDINKFIEYNLCDVEIVKLLDDQFKFLDLAVSVTTTGHVPFEWFHMSSRFIEGAVITYMRRNGNMVAPNKPIKMEDDAEEMALRQYEESINDNSDTDEEDDEEGFTGAYVKNPVPGLYSWVFSADINSLYPSTIRTLNISPETYVGRITNWNAEEFLKGNLKEIFIGGEKYTAEEFKKFIEGEKINISSIGAMYLSEKMGIIPTILELWFSQRLEFQDLMKKYAKDGNKEMEAYYTRRQHVQKIFLNSVYGILGLSTSRLYSKDNAESTTLTGQTIIKTSERIVIDFFKERFSKYGKTIEDTTNLVQYIDTDSLYISVDEMANLEGIKEEDKKEYTKKTCDEVVAKLNAIYPILAKKLFNSSTNKIKIASDTINETAFWKKKKAYALNQVYDMTKSKDVKKIKVVGLSSVRSDFPIKFKSFYEQFLKDILYREGANKIGETVLALKSLLKDCTIYELAKNTGVKFYSEQKGINFNPKGRSKFNVAKGATAQCKAALMYNDLLNIFNLQTKVEPIYTGQKIKYVYLRNNEYGLDALAFKGDGTDPKEIMDFIDTNCDKTKMYNSVLKNKIEDFFKILKWRMPTDEGKKVATMFEYDNNIEGHEYLVKSKKPELLADSASDIFDVKGKPKSKKKIKDKKVEMVVDKTNRLF
jgi:DNA polymerase elongation subunit (family B)